MGEFHGADPDELEATANKFNAVAQKLTGTRQQLLGAANSTPWQGRDADRFRNEWKSKHNTALSRAVAFLEDAAKTLRKNATEQRRASAAVSGTFDVLDDPTPPKGQGSKENQYGRPIFADGISPDDITQGSIGDCWLMSDLAALASTPGGREMLANMIADNGDGTYTVTFPNGHQERIDGDFWGPDGAHASTKTELWVGLIEKAYAQYSGGYPTIDQGTLPETVFEAWGLGGNAGQVPSMSDQELRGVLESGRPVVAWGPVDDANGFHGPYKGAHAFSLVATSHDSAGNAVFTMRNPWGNNGALEANNVHLNGDGTFTVDLATFRRLFPHVVWADRP